MAPRVSELDLGDVFPRAFDPQGSSFARVLRTSVPEAAPDWLGGGALPAGLHEQIVDGTTVLAVVYADGVVIAGDRRATAGNLISKTDMRKVFPADHHSAIAIAGAAGPAMEMARILSTELEHYEKVEGEALSLEGKSNKLAMMVRANLPLAMQGLVVVPLFAGIDPRVGTPGIFEYDPVGGRYTARKYAATGSGGLIASQTLKHGFRRDTNEGDAIALAVSALFDAAEEDSATGGPDLVRRIYPIVAVIDADGYRELDEAAVRERVDAVVADRSGRD
jgi:proteasome beta subunit